VITGLLAVEDYPMLETMLESQLVQYVPVLILFVVALAIITGMLVFSVVVGKKGKRPAIKDSAYECGMLPIGEASQRYSVKFYLVAMLFILFDIEVVFLYPWAAIYREMLVAHADMIFFSMVSFIGILTVGYIYVFKKGALSWNPRQHSQLPR
jgi:NADH-quinone oxidoreductase subunit A